MKPIIAFCLLLVLTSCATYEWHPGRCRHEAMYVGAILAEKYLMGSVIIEISLTDRKGVTHAQACIMDAMKRCRYFSMDNGAAVESPRDEISRDVISIVSYSEYIEMMKKYAHEKHK